MTESSPWKSDLLFRQLPLPALVVRGEAGDLVLADVNPAAAAANPGLAALVGRSLRALYQHQPDILTAVDECLRDGGVLVRESEVQRYDRASVNQRIRFTLAALPPDHLMMTWQDVTPAAMVNAALRESEERYRSVVDAMTEGVVVQGPDERVLSINPAAERALGLAPGAALGWRGLAPLLGDQPWPATRAFATGQEVEREGVNVALSAGQRHLAVTTRVLGTWGGPAFRGVVTTFRDVTDQARAAEALRASEERYRQIVETTTEGIWIGDLEGVIRFANPRMADLLGVTVEEIVGQSVFSWIAPEDRDRVRHNLARRAKGLSDGVELTYLRRDGSRLAASVASCPVYEGDRVVGALGMVRDRSDLRTAQVALRGTEARLQVVLDAARLGFWEWEVASDAAWWSPNLDAMFAPSGWRGMAGFLERVHPDDRDEVAALAGRLGATGVEGETFEREVRIGLRDGGTRWARLTGRVFVEGGQRRVTGTLQDVTERRTLEARLRAAQRLESVGRLAGGVAHDFNNLVGVIGMAATVLEASATEDQREDLTTIQMAAARARELTRQLLALARRQPVELRLVDAGRIVSGLERILARLVGDGVTLGLDLGDTPTPVRVDAGQLEQVLVNLVGNARDASAEGGRVTVSVRALGPDAPRPPGLQLPPGAAVRIAVTDTGPGFCEAALVHLFEPFYTTKEAGTGLGLASSYGIVRQFGGDLVARNRPEGGASVEAWLPTEE